MLEFIDLGAGVTPPAMRDLEIRGGNILGVQQSGHIGVSASISTVNSWRRPTPSLKGEQVEERRS